jgi:hypothetical protein
MTGQSRARCGIHSSVFLLVRLTHLLALPRRPQAWYLGVTWGSVLLGQTLPLSFLWIMVHRGLGILSSRVAPKPPKKSVSPWWLSLSWVVLASPFSVFTFERQVRFGGSIYFRYFRDEVRLRLACIAFFPWERGLGCVPLCFTESSFISGCSRVPSFSLAFSW